MKRCLIKKGVCRCGYVGVVFMAYYDSKHNITMKSKKGYCVECLKKLISYSLLPIGYDEKLSIMPVCEVLK